jgi:signal transduction histidine kinase
VLTRGRPLRVNDTDSDEYRGAAGQRLGVADAESILFIPMLYRGNPFGILVAFDGGTPGEGFSEEDERLLETFAVSAATALALAQTVETDRLRGAMASAEAERTRWARELHDETLQSLAALRLALTRASRSEGDATQTRAAIDAAAAEVQSVITNLRSIITDLRPAALEELGLWAALEALLDRHRDQGAFEVKGELSPLDKSKGARLDPDLESAAFRLIQEALTNISKHAGAAHVWVHVAESEHELEIEIRDDGSGFDTSGTSSGFGLAGMHERVNLVGGTLDVSSDGQGTRVYARLPSQTVGLRLPGRRAALQAMPLADPLA